ncbi:MAG: hypothetical protein L0216_19400 [Planctomycetales bacterium]|nr:hypothetical protein [Planctomycetales bacterium]
MYGVEAGEPPVPETGPRAQIQEVLASAGLAEAQVDAAVARAFESVREESDRRAGSGGPGATTAADAARARALESREAAGRLVDALGKILDRLGIREEGTPWRSRARRS